MQLARPKSSYRPASPCMYNRFRPPLTTFPCFYPHHVNSKSIPANIATRAAGDGDMKPFTIKFHGHYGDAKLDVSVANRCSALSPHIREVAGELASTRAQHTQLAKQKLDIERRMADLEGRLIKSDVSHLVAICRTLREHTKLFMFLDSCYCITNDAYDYGLSFRNILPYVLIAIAMHDGLVIGCYLTILLCF